MEDHAEGADLDGGAVLEHGTADDGAVDPDDPTRLVAGGIREQTERVIQIVEALIAECDCTLSDVAQTTVYLADLDDLDAFNEVYARHFVAPAPARNVVEVSRLPYGALVEMDCIACR